MSIIKEHARRVGALFLIDACQSVPHQPINVKELHCDFLAFSTHKMFGPTGLGVLYMKKDIFNKVPPYEVGGGTVFESDYYEAVYLPAPYKYEAGTPPIAQVIGFGAALDFIQQHIDFDALRIHEARLCALLLDGLSSIPGVVILGSIDELRTHGHLVTITINGVHPHDVAGFLSHHNVCVRAGHFCVQPLFKKWGIDGAVRISFAAYSDEQEVHAVVSALHDLVSQFNI